MDVALIECSSLLFLLSDTDRARKHGMEDFISADPCQFDHHAFFRTLQTETLDYRLNDIYCSLVSFKLSFANFYCYFHEKKWKRCLKACWYPFQGWLSPGQVFVLEEYCARYGVRGCYRHIHYLSDLLDRAERNFMIDPTLLHYNFAFCASHVHGNRYSVLVFYFSFLVNWIACVCSLPLPIFNCSLSFPYFDLWLSK